MKKLLAMLLALALILVNVAAMAEGLPAGAMKMLDQNLEADEGTAAAPTFFKVYSMEGNTGTLTYDEEITFTVEQVTTTYKVEHATLPTVGADASNKVTITVPTTADGVEIPINLPTDYTQAGVYEYKITETAGNVQGATYNTEDKVIHVMVYVVWDRTQNPAVLVPTANVYVADEEVKEQKSDTLKNKYELGNLTVEKTIDGNLADPEKYFEIEVTLTAEGTVMTPVTLTGVAGNFADETATSLTIPAAEIAPTKVITLKLKGGQTVSFADIPANVSYSVAEKNITHIETEAAQITNANDPEAYRITYTDEEGTIEANDTAAASIENYKNMEIETGIALESAPYMVIMLIAMTGAVLLVSRKRRIA